MGASAPQKKRCRDCGETKPLDEFYWQGTPRRPRPECKECKRADNGSRPRPRGHQLDWRRRNPEKARQQRRRQYQRIMEDPIRRARYQADRRNYHARRQPHNVEREAREYVAILRADPCSYCGGPTETIDHIDPIVDGGSGEESNLTAACKSCNSQKETRPLLLFLRATL